MKFFQRVYLGWALLLMFVIGLVAMFAPKAFAAARGYVLQRYSDYFEASPDGNGTHFNLIEAHDIAFAGATSATASSGVTGTYYTAATFKSSTANPGKITVAISAGTLTATVGTATTGTLSVLVFGSP